MAHHAKMGVYDICAGTLPTLAFEPSVHTFYADNLCRMQGGLPKMKDVPAVFGGPAKHYWHDSWLNSQSNHSIWGHHG